jgi:hypothetical protein
MLSKVKVMNVVVGLLALLLALHVQAGEPGPTASGQLPVEVHLIPETTTSASTTTTTSQSPSRSTPKPQINHYLKWITNQTQFPIKLSVKIGPNDLKDETYSYDWLRLKDESLVSHLPSLFKDYLITENDDQANLYIIKYDPETNEQVNKKLCWGLFGPNKLKL